MFRITTQKTGNRLLLKLEGCLSGAWVDELENCWRAEAADGRMPIRIDLREVLRVDEAGRQLLTRMHRAGAVLEARGCVMRELVREISEAIGIRGG